MNSNLKILYQLLVVPLKNLWLFICLIACSLGLLSVLLYGLSFNHLLNLDILKVTPQDISAIKEFTAASNTLIFDNNKNLISEQFNNYHLYVPYSKIPQKMIDSILAIEDRKFFEHPGIDFFGIVRASLSLLQSQNGRYSQGASTITQQVVKNLLLTNEKTYQRKIREIVLALYIEKNMSKEQILEIYCNHLFLGNGAYGVAAAAKRYFDKPLSQLNYHETALIAGLFQSPTKLNPIKNPELALGRQKIVLKSLAQNNIIDEAHLKVLQQTKLEYAPYVSQHGQIAPYYVDYVLESAKEILSEQNIVIKDSGLEIHTSLDLKLQNHLEASFTESQDIFDKLAENMITIDAEDSQQVEAASLVLDRKTGEILAMQGGRNYETSQFNRTTLAKRAAGSVFKTVSYTLALKSKRQWNEQFYISPITIGNYRPRSSLSKLYTQTTLLEAFYDSINSPAVELGVQLGINNVISYAKRLGIETPQKMESSTLLGSSEVTMLDMARVYGTIANGGIKPNPHGITLIKDRGGKILYDNHDLKFNKKSVIDPQTNDLITEGLKQVITRGTGYKASDLASYAAGKTGTSNESRDNWFCGFTKDLVVITWIGHDKQLPFKHSISASNTATPLWARFIRKANKELKTAALASPTSVEVAYINPKFGNIDSQGIPMYFSPENMPKKEKSDLIYLERGQKIRMGFEDF